MLLKIFIFGLICSSVVESDKILAVFPVSLTGDSLGYHLMNELVARGHDVTVLNLFSTETYYGHTHKKNYSEVILDNTWKVFIDLIDDDYSKNYHAGLFSAVTYAHQKAFELTEQLLSDNNFQTLIHKSKPKFDVVIMEYYLNDAALGIGQFLGIPTILFSSIPSSFHVNHIFANPAPPSFVPNILTGYTGFMNFWQRVNNLAYNSFNNIYRRNMMFSKHEKLLKKYIDPLLDLDDVIDNVDLLLINSNPVVTEPVPHMPNMIEIGGYHIKEKPLPKNIKDFMDKASKGVVIVSLRFNFGTSQADLDLLEVMSRAFQSLEQQVVWHFDDAIQVEVPNKLEYYTAPNTKDSKDIFLSTTRLFSIYDNDGTYTYEEIQHGLLGHSNTLLLVSQGDLNDIMEAVYFGIPIVGVPTNREQKANIDEAVTRGYCLSLSYEHVTEKDVVNSLSSVIQAPYYLNNAKQASNYLRHQAVKPMDLAMHWIEFVIRQGSKNLKSPGVKLHWFKRSMLDVIIFLTVVDIILFLIFYYIFKHVIRALFKTAKKAQCGSCKKYSELKNEQT